MRLLIPLTYIRRNRPTASTIPRSTTLVPSKNWGFLVQKKSDFDAVAFERGSAGPPTQSNDSSGSERGRDARRDVGRDGVERRLRVGEKRLVNLQRQLPHPCLKGGVKNELFFKIKFQQREQNVKGIDNKTIWIPYNNSQYSVQGESKRAYQRRVDIRLKNWKLQGRPNKLRNRPVLLAAQQSTLPILTTCSFQAHKMVFAWDSRRALGTTVGRVTLTPGSTRGDSSSPLICSATSVVIFYIIRWATAATPPIRHWSSGLRIASQWVRFAWCWAWN